MNVFGQEINANHIRSVRDGTLTATATPIHVDARRRFGKSSSGTSRID